MGISDKVANFSDYVLKDLKDRFEKIDEIAEINQLKVLNAFRKNNKSFKKIRQAYKLFGTQLYEYAGYSPAVAEARMKLTYDLEKELTKAHYKTFRELFQSEDVQHSVHIMSRKDLEKKYKEINWDMMFETSEGKMEVKEVDVSSPRALKIACKLLKESDLEELKCWAEFCLLWNYRPLFSQDLRRSYRAFTTSLIGNAAEPLQWKINSDFISHILGMPVGQLYCERYVSPQTKERIQVMTQNICEAFRHRIEQNPWMSEKTKQEALRKLDNIVCEIAYPDQWNSTEGLKISKDNSLYENYAQLQEYNWTQEIKRKLNQPVDRHHWEDNPQLTNAVNTRFSNSIYIFSGILQPPFFDPDADEAINYGAIGVVIAHELTHIRNKDTRLLIISIIFVGIMSTIMSLAFRMVWNMFIYGGGRSRDKKDSQGGAIVGLLIVAILAAIGYLFTLLTRFAISRKREYMADAGGAELCGNPLALASALRKISGNVGLRGCDREDIAQLFIAYPQSLSAKGFFNMFSTHPDIQKRIEILEQF